MVRRVIGHAEDLRLRKLFPCDLKDLLIVGQKVRLPLIPIDPVRHVVGTDVQKDLCGCKVEKHRINLPEEIVRRCPADSPVVDDLPDPRGRRNLGNGKHLHQRRSGEQDLSLPCMGIQNAVVPKLPPDLILEQFSLFFRCHNLILLILLFTDLIHSPDSSSSGSAPGRPRRAS